MTAELVRGQNHPLTEALAEVRVSAGRPVTVGAVLTDEQGRLAGVEGVLLPGGPAGPPGVGLPGQAAGGGHRVRVEPAALPETVHRVGIFLFLPAGERFGGGPAPFTAVVAGDAPGPPLVSYTITGLDSESAVVALELYRRQGAWKVRAVGQGYAAGLAALLTDHGLPPTEARRLADAAPVPAAERDDRLPSSPSATATPATAATATPAAQAAAAATPVSADAGAPGLPGLSATGVPGATATGLPGVPAGASPGAGSAQAAQGGAHPGGPSRVDYHHPRRRPAPSAQAQARVQQAGAQEQPGGAQAEQPPAPVAGDAAGWSMEERLYNQVWGMFEDLARAVAAHRGAVEFADNRLDQELDGVLGDYRARTDGTADRARREARTRREELVGRAQEVLDQQLAQLRAESEVVEPALPPAYARWESPVWQAYRAPGEQPLALRLGDVGLPESGPLRIPLLMRLPLERGLWIDSGESGGASGLLVTPEERRGLALDMAVALATRLLAAHPPGEFTLHVIDGAGAGARALAPLSRAGALDEAPAVGPGAVSGLLKRLAGHVDLVQMAVRAGAAESLPPGTDLSQRLLIVHDFPHAFDDRAVTALRYLADEGPRAGVHLLMVADREDAAGFGALLDPLWRSLLRLTPVPEDHLADPWVRHAWTYEPSLPSPGGAAVEEVLARVMAARRR
jgi:stress response protein SCP2